MLIWLLTLSTLAPALPASDQVFEPRSVERWLVDRCGSGPCGGYQEVVLRLRGAYESPAATDEQRFKMLQIVDKNTGPAFVDWLKVDQEYFAWRASQTKERVVVVERPPSGRTDCTTFSTIYTSWTTCRSE